VTVQRVAVAIVALVAAAWLAVSYADSRVIEDVQSTVSAPHPTPPQLEGALRHLRSARTLDPSRGVEVLSFEASLLIRLNRIPEAVRTLEELVRREPDLVEAWFLIAKFSRPTDPARAAAADAQVRRLNPPVRRKHR
jgi:predicted Zn-dependent protease